MLSNVEKVLILKSVDMFSHTPDNVLADVADLLEELDVSENETIFEKGDTGDSMYVILDGKVRVHDGERLLNYLGEHDVFGEMALLDPEPRLASVTAVEAARLLYYAVDQAVWLVSDSPTGPWVVVDTIPPEIETIPPESPVYNVKYVRVYDSTPAGRVCWVHSWICRFLRLRRHPRIRHGILLSGVAGQCVLPRADHVGVCTHL